MTATIARLRIVFDPGPRAAASVIRRVGSFEHRSFEVELGRGGQQDRAGEVLPHRRNNNGPTRQGEIFENGSSLGVGPAGEVLPVQVKYVE